MPAAAVVIMIVLFIIMASVGALTTLPGMLGKWFSPARAVVRGVTPVEVKADYLYSIVADGPFRKVRTDANGVASVSEFTANGACVRGCEPTTLDARAPHSVRITSLDDTRQLHITLRECRIRESWFRYVCD